MISQQERVTPFSRRRMPWHFFCGEAVGVGVGALPVESFENVVAEGDGDGNSV